MKYHLLFSGACVCLGRWRAAFHMHWVFCGDNLRVQVSGDGGAAVLVPLGCTEWASLCHLQVCVQGQPEAGSVLLSLVTDITRHCGSGFAGASEPQFSHNPQFRFLYCRDNSSFVLWTLCQTGLCGPAQRDASALLCKAPGAGSGCKCQENSHP